jgi:hypothetical protein
MSNCRKQSAIIAVTRWIETVPGKLPPYLVREGPWPMGVSDVQLIINQALGVTSALDDLNTDHIVNVR